MSDGFSLVCPGCGRAADLSAGLTPNEDGKLLCADCGGEIPVPLAAPDDSLGDTTTASPGDLPTIVDAQHEVENKLFTVTVIGLAHTVLEPYGTSRNAAQNASRMGFP